MGSRVHVSRDFITQWPPAASSVSIHTLRACSLADECRPEQRDDEEKPKRQEPFLVCIAAEMATLKRKPRDIILILGTPGVSAPLSTVPAAASGELAPAPQRGPEVEFWPSRKLSFEALD